MKDSELTHIKSISDITEEVLSKLTAEQAKMLRKRFGVDTSKLENSLPVQEAFDKTRLRIKEIEEKYRSKARGKNEPPEPEDS